MISVTCQKGDYQLTFKNTTTACTRDLGINCNQGKQVSQTQLLSLKLFGTDNPVGTCIRTYHFCQPNTCQPLRKIVHTTVLNQCSRSECCTNEVTACPSPTLTMHVSGTTNVLNMSSTASTNCPSVTPRLPDSRIRASTVNGAIIPVTGALVGLLVMLLTVVTTGWVYTCSRRTELGLRSQSIRYIMHAFIDSVH